MKHKKTTKRFLAMILVIACVLGLCPQTTVLAENSTWTISDNTEIFWVKTDDSEKAYEALTEQVKLFSSELAEKVTETALPISYGDVAKAGENDIILNLNSTLGIATQGYKIVVNGSQVIVSASDADGLFYGCRNVIQQLLIDGNVAAAEEAPDVLERGLSLDNGRKYYSVEWIKEMIRELSWSNMNALALHFSEEMGLGIESKLYPWLNGRDGELCTQAAVVAEDTVLTQEEVKVIVEYANLYHVEIIPSFDSPGHMNYIVKKFNEKCATEDYTFTYDGKTYTAEAGSEIGNYFHYNGQTSIVKGSRNANYSRGIDISNEVAVAFTRSLVEEYATLFKSLGCTKFDIGGDELLGWGSAVVSGVNKWQQLDHWKEYAQNRAEEEGISNWASAVAYDGFMYYMNDMYDLVSELGYTSVRMWNDDALRSSDTGWTGVVQLNENIDIWFWATGSNTVWDYLNAGYQVYNILSDYNYYAMTSDYFSDSRSSFAQAYADQIYDEWTPFTFGSSSTAIGNANVLGSAFAIWSDNPTLKTADEVMDDVVPMLYAHGAKAWDATANTTVPYATFTANMEKLGDAPEGTIVSTDIYVVADITVLEELVAEYTTMDSTMYTADSFSVYANAIEEGKALLVTDKPSQTDVDALVSKIKASKEQLQIFESYNSELKLYKATFTGTRVNKGRAATLNVLVSTNTEKLVIYDDLGNLVNYKSQAKTSAKTSIENTVFICTKFIANDAGVRTYTIYAVDAEGNKSVDSIQASITVR